MIIVAEMNRLKGLSGDFDAGPDFFQAEFRIFGLLRYLSHAETLVMFERSLRRSGIKVSYSRGFNPRPRISLPLPRPVGIESSVEMLTAEVEGGLGEPRCSSFRDRLNSVLPSGCEITDVKLFSRKSSVQPQAVRYSFCIRDGFEGDLNGRADAFMQSESMVIERVRPGRAVKKVDVRGFIESVVFSGRRMDVACRVSAGGQVRIDEIMRVLEIGQEMLEGPVTRVGVDWS